VTLAGRLDFGHEPALRFARFTMGEGEGAGKALPLFPLGGLFPDKLDDPVQPLQEQPFGLKGFEAGIEEAAAAGAGFDVSDGALDNGFPGLVKEEAVETGLFRMGRVQRPFGGRGGLRQEGFDFLHDPSAPRGRWPNEVGSSLDPDL